MKLQKAPTRPRDHGYSAFARADVGDAKRGHPAGSLEEYARSRRLELHARASLAGFRMALPGHQEYQHNLVRGVLPGGRWGILLHELLQTHSGTTMPGSFWGVRINSPGSVWRSLVPDRTDLPVVGWFLDPARDDAPREAFDSFGAWAPVTTVATAVPETVAPLRRLRVVRKDRVPLRGGGPWVDLDGGWRAYFDEHVRDGLLDELFAGPAAEVLQVLVLPYAELSVDYGMLRVRRNGYLLEPSALDSLAGLTCAFAAALVACCRPLVASPSLDDPLPGCPWLHEDRAVAEPGLAPDWTRDFRGFAAGRGLALEDPAAWHERFPAQPLPGRVVASLRGRLADAGPTGRILFTTDVPIGSTRAVRGAIAVRAAAGVEDTSPGGIRPPGFPMTCSVRDGIATVWTNRLYGYCSEAEELVSEALAAARAAGVLDG
jgi:hypothetical protein